MTRPRRQAAPSEPAECDHAPPRAVSGASGQPPPAISAPQHGTDASPDQASGNRQRISPGRTGIRHRSADTAPAASPEPHPSAPHNRSRTRSTQQDPSRQADLDAYITQLVDAAPPLTGEQRDTLALLLRRPHHR